MEKKYSIGFNDFFNIFSPISNFIKIQPVTPNLNKLAS